MTRIKQAFSCWDACVFTAWLANEPREKAEMDGIERMAREIEQGRRHVVTSAITLMEVMRARLRPEAQERFDQLFRHPSWHLYDVTRRVILKATDIREHIAALPRDEGDSTTVSSPDAIHLAAAVLYPCDNF